MSRLHDSLRCPRCRLHIRFERDLFGGVREWCVCGWSQPLEKRAAPPIERELPRPGKSHCSRGHSFSKKNTYVDADGRRSCRTCRRHAMADLRQRAVA